ncbi:hypothetical protein GMLC_17810 [Geomonas limicola]|uniref:Uncharacterized protein n=1 Tax=Geomonas limicola TaxID=2740186 RepID=A0A6V8N6J1_9BACT|nr:hypothetical protein [Geomonas limicola]GFO68202.1 hypothetical protein GMLC_17810 [Geomonas limicola]
MKKKAYCPACGNRELTKLFITTNRGKALSLLLTSQSDLRKSSGDVCCIQCQHVWRITHLHKE